MKTLLLGLLAILLLNNPGAFAATQNDAISANAPLTSTATQQGEDQSAQSAKTKEQQEKKKKKSTHRGSIVAAPNMGNATAARHAQFVEGERSCCDGIACNRHAV